MDTPRATRPIPLFLTALVAFFSALVALAVSNGHAHAHGNEPHPASATIVVAHAPASEARRAVALRTDLRKLWEDHITWTRLAIISLTTGSPDTQATVARLLRNQTDIGNAVKPFYGQAAGSELTRQLRKHIMIAAEVVAAAKLGDQGKLADAQARWTTNGDDIARVLNSVNPSYWKLPAMKAELRTHLRLTTHEAVARITGNWGPTWLRTTRSITTRCTSRTSSRRASSSSSPSGSAEPLRSNATPRSGTLAPGRPVDRSSRERVSRHAKPAGALVAGAPRGSARRHVRP